MKKCICIVCAAVLLVAGLTGCKAKKYEETIAVIQVEIGELEVDKEQLEDKNDGLSTKVRVLEARPTVTPTPEPTPILEPLGKPLDIGITDFLMGFVRYVCIYDEDDRPIELDEIAYIKTEDFTIKERIDDPRKVDYIYTYEDTEMIIEVDLEDRVHSIYVHCDHLEKDDGELDNEKLTFVVLLQALVLQSVYGMKDGTDIFLEITETFVKEDVVIEHEDDIIHFALNTLSRSVSLEVSHKDYASDDK